MRQYKVVIFHSEWNSIFSVINYDTENEEDWIPVKSFRSKEIAEEYAKEYNDRVIINNVNRDELR